MTVSQVSYNIGRANIWEIHFSMDSVALIKRPIQIPGANLFVGPYSCTHMHDGSIFVLNSTLNIWSVGFDLFFRYSLIIYKLFFPLHKVQGQKCSLIIDNHLFPEDNDFSLKSGSQLAHCSEVASALSTVEVDLTQKRIFLFNYRGNVTVVDPEGTVRVYKKNPTTQEWEPFFRIRSPLPFLATARPRDPDHHVIYGITTQGTILRLEDNGPNKSWTLIKDYDRYSQNVFKLVSFLLTKDTYLELTS